MLGNGEIHDRIIRPEFNRSIVMDFLGTKITSDAGFLALREIDQRFKVTAPMGREIDDPRSPVHIKHSMVEMIRQRVYQIAAGYEDCIGADFLRSFEGKILVTQFIPAVLMGLGYLWGTTVKLETTEFEVTQNDLLKSQFDPDFEPKIKKVRVLYALNTKRNPPLVRKVI